MQVIKINTNTYMSPACLLNQPEAHIPNLKRRMFWTITIKALEPCKLFTAISTYITLHLFI